MKHFCVSYPYKTIQKLAFFLGLTPLYLPNLSILDKRDYYQGFTASIVKLSSLFRDTIVISCSMLNKYLETNFVNDELNLNEPSPSEFSE